MFCVLAFSETFCWWVLPSLELRENSSAVELEQQRDEFNFEGLFEFTLKVFGFRVFDYAFVEQQHVFGSLKLEGRQTHLVLHFGRHDEIAEQVDVVVQLD
jgi:hypothetical protein